MAVSGTWYTAGLEAVMKGEVDLEGDTIKVALLDDAYTPDQNHESFADVSDDEVSGTGYTAGGATLTNKSVTSDPGGGHATFDAGDVTWADSEISARYAVIYDDSHTDKVLLALIDFGELMESSNGPFTIQWNASGILRFSLAA